MSGLASIVLTVLMSIIESPLVSLFKICF